jgi:flagellar hook-associated protein 2
LVDAEKLPLKNAIDAKIAKSEAAISGYSAIMFMLNDLNTAIADLKDTSDFNNLNVTGGESTAFSLTASDQSEVGSHRIRVNSLFQEQVSISDAFASETVSINGNQSFNMTLTLGGVATPVTVSPNGSGEITPAEIVSAINAAQAGVSAKLVNTGTSVNPSFRMVLTGEAGSDQAFSLDVVNSTSAPSASTLEGDAGTSTTEATTLTFGALGIGDQLSVGGLTLTVTANMTDAEVATAFASVLAGTTPANGVKFTFSGSLSGFDSGTVANGNEVVFTSVTANQDVTNLSVSLVPSRLSFTQLQAASDAEVVVDGVTYQRETNAVDDILTGTVITLKGVSAATTTTTLARDNTVIQTKLQAVVDAYNNAQSLLKEVSNSKSDLETYGGTLVGSSTVRLIGSRLRNLMSTNSNTPGASIGALWQLGIKFDAAGVMSLDSTKLDTALSENHADVVTALTGNKNNLSQYDKTTPAGVMGEAWRSLNTLMSATGPLMTQSDNASSKITDYNEQLAALDTRMTRLLDRYTKQFSDMQSLVGSTNSLKTSLESSFAGLMAMYTGKNN